MNGLFQQGNANDVTKQLIEQLSKQQTANQVRDPIARQGGQAAAQLFSGFNPQVIQQKKRDGLFAEALKKSKGNVSGARDSVIESLLESDDTDGALELILQRDQEASQRSATALETLKTRAEISKISAEATGKIASANKNNAEVKQMQAFEKADLEIKQAKALLAESIASLNAAKQQGLPTKEQAQAVREANTAYKKTLARTSASQSKRLATNSNFLAKVKTEMLRMVELGEQNSEKFKAYEKLASLSDKKDPTIELLERLGIFGDTGGVPAGATPGINPAADTPIILSPEDFLKQNGL